MNGSAEFSVTSLLAFVFVLGVLVFVHELGHFLAARRIGVRVLTFSARLRTEAAVASPVATRNTRSARIPLGGYVKMAGENPEDSRTGAPDEFLSKSKWERFQVLVMGPIMNLALAWLVMAAVLYQGAQVPAFDRDPSVIGAVTAKSVAEQAGLQVGDRIVAVERPAGRQLGRVLGRRPAQGQPADHAVDRARRHPDRAPDHASRDRQVRPWRDRRAADHAPRDSRHQRRRAGARRRAPGARHDHGGQRRAERLARTRDRADPRSRRPAAAARDPARRQDDPDHGDAAQGRTARSASGPRSASSRCARWSRVRSKRSN